MRPPIRLVETDDRPALKLVGEDDTPLNLRDTESFDIPEATPEELSNLKEPINITAERSTTDVGKPLMQDVVEINPVKAAHSQKQIDLLIPKIQEIMEKGVMGNPDYFKDEKNRERFFNNLSSRYTEEEISQLKGEKRIPALDKFTEERQAEMEQGDGYMQQRKPLTPLGESEGFARIMSSPADAFTHGIIGGWDKLKETGNVYDKEGDIAATGNAVAAVTHMVMGGLNLLPAMAAFTVSATVAGEIAPETTEAILAPITAITDPQTEGGKSWAQIGDFLAFAGVLWGAVKGKAVLKGKGAEAGKAGAEGIAEGLKDFSKLPIEEQKTKIEDYAQEIVKENKFESNLTPTEKQVFTFSKQAQDLMKEIENAPDELKPIYEAKLAEVDTKHTEAVNEATTQNIADAANKTVSDNLQEAKTILENHEPTTETGKALKEEHLSKLNKAINELNPKQNEKISEKAKEETGKENADAKGQDEVLTENVPEETKVSEPVSSEALNEADKIATDNGFKNKSELLGSVKKRRPSEAKETVQEIKPEIIKEVAEERKVEKENKGKEIEPNKEVKTDVETVVKELGLSDTDKVIYDELKNIPDSQKEDVLKKVIDEQDDRITKLEKDKELADAQTDNRKDDIDREIDSINDSEMKDGEKKKAIAKLEKEYKGLDRKQKKKEKEIDDEIDKTEKTRKELEKHYYLGDEFDFENINNIISKVDARLETRKAVKAGTDLFPEDANIPELKNKEKAVVSETKVEKPETRTSESETKVPVEETKEPKSKKIELLFEKQNEIVKDVSKDVSSFQTDTHSQITKIKGFLDSNPDTPISIEHGKGGFYGDGGKTKTPYMMITLKDKLGNDRFVTLKAKSEASAENLANYFGKLIDEYKKSKEVKVNQNETAAIKQTEYEKGNEVSPVGKSEQYKSSKVYKKGEKAEVDGQEYFVNGLDKETQDVFTKAKSGGLENQEYEMAKRKVKIFNAKYIDADADVAAESRSWFDDKKQPTTKDVKRAMVWSYDQYGDYQIKAGGGSASDNVFVSSFKATIADPKTGLDKDVVILKKYGTSLDDVLITIDEIQKLQDITENQVTKNARRSDHLGGVIGLLVRDKQGFGTTAKGEIAKREIIDGLVKEIANEYSTKEINDYLDARIKSVEKSRDGDYVEFDEKNNQVPEGQKRKQERIAKENKKIAAVEALRKDILQSKTEKPAEPTPVKETEKAPTKAKEPISKTEKASDKKPQPIKVGDDVRFTAMGTDRTGIVKSIGEDGKLNIESTTSWEKGFKHTIKPEDILKKGETSRSRFDKKVDEVAEKIKEKVKPKGLKGIKVSKAGLGFDEVVDAAAKIVKQAHKVKGDIEVAIKKAIAYIEKNWDEAWGEFKESDFDSIFREELNVVPASTIKAKESKISNLSPDVSASMLRKSTILTEKTLQAKVKLTWDKFYKGYVKHIEDISGNAKEALRNAGGQEAVMLKDIANKSSGKASLKINQFDKEIFKGLDKNQMRSLGEIIEAKRAIQLDEIYDARRVDRLKHESGFTSEFYKNALDDMKAKDKDGFADIEKRADDYFKAQQELLDLKKENGMIGQEGYDKLLEQSLYSPRIYIQHLNEAGAAINGGKKISVGSGDIKRLDEGSEGLIVKDPRLLLATSISKVYAITEKNNAAKSLLKFAQENLDNGVVRERKIVGETKTGTPILEDVPSGHDIVSAMVDGQKKDMIVSKEFASEWVSTDPAISVAFGEAMQWLTGSAALRMAATGYNPLFALANAPRDMAYIYFTTDVYSPHLPVMAKQIHQDMFNVAADVFARKGRYKEFINEGGSIEYLTHQGRFYTGKAANEGVNKALRVLSYVGETSELLTRVALRERGIQNRTEKFIKANDKPPNAEELKKIKIESTYDAINQLDFSQGGDWAKAVNKFVPYVNAAFQASRGLARAARRNPKQFAYKAGQLVALAGGLAAYNLTQEGFDEVDADEKSRNYIIMLGGMYRIDEKGNKRYKYLKIPKTQDAYFISSMAEQTVEFIQNGKKPDKQSWLAAKGQMPPIPFITTNPPIMEGIRTYQSNYDAYFDKKLWYGSLDAPNELQFYKNTPEAYKIIGDATGLSPIKLRGGISKVVPNIEKNPFLAIPIKAFAIAAEAMGVKEKTNLDKSFGKNMEDALGGLYKKYIGETYVQEKSTKKFTGSTPDPEELKLTPEEKRQMKEDAEEAKKLLREEKNYVE